MAEIRQMQIDLYRYLTLLEDSAILRQIESLTDRKMDDREMSNSIREIVAEMRISRGLPIGEPLENALQQMGLHEKLNTFSMWGEEQK